MNATRRLRWLAWPAVVAVGVASALGAPIGPTLTAGVVVLLAVVLGPRFLRGLADGALTAPPSVTDAMTGVQFEDHVALLARRARLPVATTPVTGDWGVDLVVGQRPGRIAVQCKRQSRPVGAAAVQQVVAGAAMHDCVHTAVVTNASFTPAARRLAQRHGTLLVGGDVLSDLPRRLTRLAKAPAPDPTSLPQSSA